MEQISSGCYVIDADYNVVAVNAVAKSIYPQLEVGKKCYACLQGLDSPCGPCPVAAGRQGPQIYNDPIRGIAEVVEAVDLSPDGRPGKHALVFSTVGKQAEYAASLPLSTGEIRNFSLIQALTLDYTDVYTVNLADETVVMYRHDNSPIPMDSPYHRGVNYAEALRDYVRRYVYPDDRDVTTGRCDLRYIRQKLAESESMAVHYRVLLNGSVHYYRRQIVRLGPADSFRDIVVGVSCEDNEIRERQLLEELERNLVEIEYDSLTGLYTREAFLVNGEALLRHYPNKSFDYCVMKLENLSLINHQYGRTAGDRLLRLIGQQLALYRRDTSRIAYMGDGTFASLTENDPDEVRRRNVEQFRDTVLRLSDIKGISMKWAFYKNIRVGHSVEEISAKTSFALSTIRASLQEDYVEFDRSMIERMDRRKQIEDSFGEAMMKGEFSAWYQPKYSAVDGRIVGAEALARWCLSDGSCIMPGEFIPVLENNGKIGLLDAYIFRRVCELQQRAREENLVLPAISVNLSRASMLDLNVPLHYARIAAEHQVPSAGIPIEITESAAVRAIHLQSLASGLTQQGFPLHMDDFGSGYSSLASLQVIPFDTIKLDKSLVDFIGCPGTDSLLRHTVAYARESGLHVVAEGVETAAQLDFLRGIGCDAVQGYYFARPMCEKDFLKLLRESAK